MPHTWIDKQRHLKTCNPKAREFFNTFTPLEAHAQMFFCPLAAEKWSTQQHKEGTRIHTCCLQAAHEISTGPGNKRRPNRLSKPIAKSMQAKQHQSQHHTHCVPAVKATCSRATIIHNQPTCCIPAVKSQVIVLPTTSAGSLQAATKSIC